jgi:hypothetical protein
MFPIIIFPLFCVLNFVLHMFLNFISSYAQAYVPYVVPKRSHVSFAFCIFEIYILGFHFVFHVMMEYFIFSFYCLLLDVCYFTTFCYNSPPPKNNFILIISEPIYCYSDFISPIQSYVLSNVFIFSIYISEPFVPQNVHPKCFF